MHRTNNSSVSLNSIRAYLEKNNPDRVDEFVKNSPAAVKRVIADFSNFEVTTYIRMFPL